MTGKGQSKMEHEQLKQVTIKDFASSFGTPVEDIPPICKQLIAKKDFRYRVLEGKARDRVILDVLRKIESELEKNNKD